MTTEIERRLNALLGKIRRLDIWGKAQQIVKDYGRVKEEERSDHMRVSGSAELSLAGHSLTITYASFGQFHENTSLRIQWDSRLVAHLEETMHQVEEDRVRVVKEDRSSWIVARIFNDGEWVPYINPKRIASEVTKQKKKLTQDSVLRKREGEKALRETAVRKAGQDLGLGEP